MREKQRKTVITFSTTTAAIRMEKCCKEASLPGRLIPIPSSITAGCGLSWAVDPKETPAILAMMKREGLKPEGVYELEI